MAIPEIAILVETDSSWGRNLLRGVASYARKFGPWNLVVESHAPGYSQKLGGSWRADGVIARITTPLLLRQIQALAAPAVDVGDHLTGVDGVDSVISDADAWAKLAIGHFRSKGFAEFAYYGPPSRDYSKRRGSSFAAAAEAEKIQFTQYSPGYRVGREISREEHRRRVGRWVSQLPSRVAVLSADAKRGKDLAEIATSIGRAIPDDFAILAGDSDELFCQLCTPPLSSIDVSSNQIGWEAAARIAERLKGQPSLSEPILISPKGVESRQSTDVLAIDDPIVMQAIRYMQSHACSGITVDDVLTVVPAARRQLERLFRAHLGRSPADELRRLRLEKGRQLLAESELSIEDVAIASGYAGATQFGAAFRSTHGLTPLAYRRRSQSQ